MISGSSTGAPGDVGVGGGPKLKDGFYPVPAPPDSFGLPCLCGFLAPDPSAPSLCRAAAALVVLTDPSAFVILPSASNSSSNRSGGAVDGAGFTCDGASISSSAAAAERDDEDELELKDSEDPPAAVRFYSFSIWILNFSNGLFVTL